MADYIPVVAPVGITKHGDICAEDLLELLLAIGHFKAQKPAFQARQAFV